MDILIGLASALLFVYVGSVLLIFGVVGYGYIFDDDFLDVKLFSKNVLVFVASVLFWPLILIWVVCRYGPPEIWRTTRWHKLAKEKEKEWR